MTKSKRTMKLSISKKKYNQLLKKRRLKKKLTKKQTKLLNDSLYIQYCRCLRAFEYKKDKRGYAICMNSVYKKRNSKPPKNASNKCKQKFKNKT
jgi:hypothetical protein